MKDRDAKRALAVLAGERCDGALSRRRFLNRCSRLGLGFSAAALAAMTTGRPWPRLVRSAQAAADPDDATASWLRDVGRGFRGASVRLVSEMTPPSLIIRQLAEQEFTPLTGIEVQFELLSLERVLQRASLDIAAQTARYDIYYLDQSWIARFAEDTLDPHEKYLSQPDLAMPGYDWADLLPSLVSGIATYRDKLVGIPFDVPIFIMFYRRDLLEELGLPVPTTMADYMATIEAVQRAKAPDIYGTTGQMMAGHYSLNCEWTAWLWANGGSVFDADGYFSGGDAQGLEGLDYMLRLYANMPPYVDTWNWDGETQSLLQGLAGLTLTWAEIFPALDDPTQSLVPGLMGAAPPPHPTALRAPADCGYGEVPNIGHQGGSALALSRYSTGQDAAWIFLQWATSAEVQTRASLLGGGASPTRRSVFEDPRVTDAAKVQAGTTRHFDAVLKTIETAMGSEPDLPVWPDISTGVIPRELGYLLRREEPDGASTMATIKEEVDAMTAPYRRSS
jgi:multiple sugar transport system substrate-binding protein